MNDKEFRIEVNRIRKLIKKWFKPLGLNWWQINFQYVRDNKSPDVPSSYAPMDINGVWECPMETHCDPNYLRGTVIFYCPVLQSMSDDDVEEGFLHELMHIFLSPMHTRQCAKEEETVATKLAQAFIWVFDDLKKQLDKKKGGELNKTKDEKVYK